MEDGSNDHYRAKSASRVYVITVKPEAGVDDADAIRGLRYLLKRLLRNHKMRCVGLGTVDWNVMDGNQTVPPADEETAQ